MLGYRMSCVAGPEDYEKLFASAPFARHGGLTGTTKRLSAWCMSLARSANGETFPPQFLVLVLCFIDTPRYIAGALPFCIDRSMERLAYRIEDSGWFVRFNSVQVLPQVADTGDDRAISVLIDMLADKDQHVRSAAVESLSEVVFKDDRSVHQTLSVCMEDPNPLLREAAAQALPQVAERGDEFVASVLFPHLEDVDPRVKKAVKESLKLLGRDDLVSSLAIWIVWIAWIAAIAMLCPGRPTLPPVPPVPLLSPCAARPQPTTPKRRRRRRLALAAAVAAVAAVAVGRVELLVDADWLGPETVRKAIRRLKDSFGRVRATLFASPGDLKQTRWRQLLREAGVRFHPVARDGSAEAEPTDKVTLCWNLGPQSHQHVASQSALCFYAFWMPQQTLVPGLSCIWGMD
eukprot:s2786_g7.t4